MIELTDEQKLILRELLIEYGINISLDVSESWSNELLKSLTIDQIKQLAEAKNTSVIEWVEFDANDKSTHPKEFDFVITDKGVGTFHLTEGWLGSYCPHFEVADFGKGFYPHFGIEHWQPLPEPPAGKE